MKRIKILLMNLAKRNLMFRKSSRYILNAYRRLTYKIKGINEIVDEQMILFCSFNGKSYADSPKAIYKFMKNNNSYENYKFIWILKEPEKYEELKKEKNTVIIKQGTKEQDKYFLRAKYWFCNYRVMDYLVPKKNQIYVQCWHGTPLKRLGFDLEKVDNALNTLKEMQNKYKNDAKKFKYLISPSKFTSEKLASAFNIKALNKEDCIIEEGYPRNDYLINYKNEDIEIIKEKLGIKNNKRIILYAPTWRDNQHQAGIGYTYKTEVDFDKLQRELGQDYIILFRAHYFVSNTFDFEKYKGFIYNVSDIDDINEVYIVSDVLITDYSSVFFDYANLKRPIIFYMYDFEKYKNEMRGFYINLEELPGKITKTEEELMEEIRQINKNYYYDEKYKKFNEKFNYLDDGKASERVVKRIGI